MDFVFENREENFYLSVVVSTIYLPLIFIIYICFDFNNVGSIYPLPRFYGTETPNNRERQFSRLNVHNLFQLL